MRNNGVKHKSAETVGTADGIDLEDDAQVDRAVLRAAQAALRDHKKNGYPVVAWQDGKVVHIAPEDIVVPDENAI